MALRPDNLNTWPGFFQREPREHLREKRKKTKYFDDFARLFVRRYSDPTIRDVYAVFFARPFAPPALRLDNLNTWPGFFQRERREHLREKREKTLRPNNAALTPGYLMLPRWGKIPIPSSLQPTAYSLTPTA